MKPKLTPYVQGTIDGLDSFREELIRSQAELLQHANTPFEVLDEVIHLLHITARAVAAQYRAEE